MDRRALLGAVGAAGAVGLSGASGCVGAIADAVDDGDTGEWRHGTGGTVDAVADGRVFCRRGGLERGDGAVFALDAASGERLWGFGRTGPLWGHTRLTVADAVYVGLGDDAIGNGSGTLYAREFDGEERWTREFGSVYERPKVADGVVYVGTDDGVVRALDAEDGAVLWRADGFGPAPDVVAVTDTVYVADEGLAALDREDGKVRWRYGGEDNVRATVADGVAYVDTYDRLAAVRDGERLWSLDAGRVEAATPDYLFVDAGDRVAAVGRATGDRAWRSNPGDPPVAVSGGVAYVGGDRVAAIDVGDWTERWAESFGDGERVKSFLAGEDGEGVVYAVVDDERIEGLDADGERVRQYSVDSPVVNGLVDGRVYVGANEGVYGFDPQTTTASR